jgi:hypothetical protein
VLRIRWSPSVGHLPSQENQGGVGIPWPPTHGVCDLDHGDVSTGDNDNNNNDNNLCGVRKILHAIHVGTGLRLRSPALATGGLRMQVLVDRRAAGPLLQCGSCCCHRCHPHHAFLVLYGCDVNRGGFGVGNQDHGGGWGQQQHGRRATKWVREDQQKATTNL